MLFLVYFALKGMTIRHTFPLATQDLIKKYKNFEQPSIFNCKQAAPLLKLFFSPSKLYLETLNAGIYTMYEMIGRMVIMGLIRAFLDIIMKLKIFSLK